MTAETIVAAFDTAAEAQYAKRDIEAANIAGATVTEHASDSLNTTGGVPARKEPGFWSKLFGMDDETYDRDTATMHDHTVYDRTLDGGGSILTVTIADVERDAELVLSILESHNPIDLEERATSYAGTTATSDTVVPGLTAPAAYSAPAVDVAPVATSHPGSTSEVIQLAEEALQVGKRVINRGTTRIRRYVVETPVSEDVSLRNESVSIERRPVTGAVAADAFTDKTIEVTEMNEEAVIGKTARVVEEVVVSKHVDDRVETVNDTVRREQVEVEKLDTAGTSSVSGVRPL